MIRGAWVIMGALAMALAIGAGAAGCEGNEPRRARSEDDEDEDGATSGSVTSGGACTAAADCPPGSECEAPTCTAGVCGLTPAATYESCSIPGRVCLKGACVCLTDECGDACVDRQSDPTHCGECGRECGGAACSKGICQPTVIASNQGSPTELAIDATHLYWVNNASGEVMKAPKQGGAPVTLASGQSGPVGLAVDDTHVYFSNATGSQIMKVAKDGAGLTPLVENASARLLAIDADSVYWAVTQEGVVKKVSKSGGVPVVVIEGMFNPRAVAVHADLLYVLASSQVRWVSTGPGGVDDGFTFGLTTHDESHLVVDGTNLYLSAKEAVVQYPLTFGAGETLYKGDLFPTGIAVDGATAYLATQTQIVRVPVGGGPLFPLSAPSSPYDVEVDATRVYWTDNKGQVLSVVK